jgi:hypothetical protein
MGNTTTIPINGQTYVPPPTFIPGQATNGPFGGNNGANRENYNNANAGWNPNQGGWNVNQAGQNGQPQNFKGTAKPGETELLNNAVN